MLRDPTFRGGQVKAQNRHFPYSKWQFPCHFYWMGEHHVYIGAWTWVAFCGHGASHHFSRQLNQSRTPQKQKRNSKKWSNGSQRLKPSCWANKKSEWKRGKDSSRRFFKGILDGWDMWYVESLCENSISNLSMPQLLKVLDISGSAGVQTSTLWVKDPSW